ncbi:MAG: S-layer homology domain-containing protein, partial [Armatimonadota bacterium]|nr:S-layer homology domain-containing protein [Armatimonadota bacterium]
MKKAALFVTAALLLALVAPVFAQPFADVPTDHWAYDAIAELAAKGLVEGYPDGTFKGDRALTRYEMAMIVARLLARIEAVAAQIPGPPPAPEVRRADLDAVRRDITALRSSIDTINRLVREFQTDLQALGVRIESIEEELRTLKAGLDKTKITGSYSGKYTSYVTPKAPPVQFSQKISLEFTGQVTPTVTAVAGVSLSGTQNLYEQPAEITKFLVPGVSGAALSNAGSWSYDGWLLSLDKLYLDVKNVLGFLNLRLGRQAISFGPYGLLLSGSGDAVLASTSVNGIDFSAAAIRSAKWSRSWDYTVDPATDKYTLTRVTTLAGRAAFKLIPGWEFGVNLRSDSGDQQTTESKGAVIGTHYGVVTLKSDNPTTTFIGTATVTVVGTDLDGEFQGKVKVAGVEYTVYARIDAGVNASTGAIVGGTILGQVRDSTGVSYILIGSFTGTVTATAISGSFTITAPAFLAGTGTFSGDATGPVYAWTRTVTTTGLSGQGLGFDLAGNLLAGVSLKLEYMGWTPSGGTQSPFLQAGLGFDFSALTGTEVPFSPTLDLSYKKFGANAPGVNTSADTDLTAWGATLGLKLTPTVSLTTAYENVTPVAAAKYDVVDVTVGYDLAQATKLALTYHTSSKGPETY